MKQKIKAVKTKAIGKSAPQPGSKSAFKATHKGENRKNLEPVLEDSIEDDIQETDSEDWELDEDSAVPPDSEILNQLPALSSPTLPESTGEDFNDSSLEEREDHPIDRSPGTHAISPQDPLRRYLDEIRRYPLLDAKQEYELAIRLREHGDVSAAKALISANLRLVVKIAFEYRSIYSNVMDLIQEGNIGLMKAVAKFDPSKGAKLGYYSSWWIRSYILKYLLDNFRLVKVGTTQAQKKLFYHLMREKERLEAQGLIPKPKLLADKLNVREKDVIEMEQRLSGQGAEMSLDTPIDREEGQTTTHKDQVQDTHESADEALAKEQLLQILQVRLPEFKKTLNDKEIRILTERLLAEEPKTLQEIADHYGLTRERTRQIEVKVIEKLRDFLKPVL
jgi:RNA polymerase sigma-32 factor